MNRTFALALSIFFSSELFSQNMILMDPVSNRVFSTAKYSDIKGTPFLFDKWIQGTVTTGRGIYDKLQLKLDVYNNTLLFHKNEESYEFQENVISFILMPIPDDSSSYLYFKRGITGAQIKPHQFVEVLVEGPVSLYKSDIKLLSELNVINSGVVKSFNNSTRYFVVKDGNIQLIKLNKQEVTSIIKDKEEVVQSYINENKLSPKKEIDLVKILKYYNYLGE